MTEPTRDELAAADELTRLRADIVRQYQAQARIDMDEIAALKRGEFICSKCGLRKDGEGSNQTVTF